jgi:hypothetical protein
VEESAPKCFFRLKQSRVFTTPQMHEQYLHFFLLHTSCARILFVRIFLLNNILFLLLSCRSSGKYSWFIFTCHQSSFQFRTYIRKLKL